MQACRPLCKLVRTAAMTLQQQKNRFTAQKCMIQQGIPSSGCRTHRLVLPLRLMVISDLNGPATTTEHSP